MKPVIMRKTSLAFATAACLATLNPAFAATVIADADSHVWKGANGNTNYGTATDLHAQDYLATSSLLLFIRFDLSSYTPGSFTDAKLDLTSSLTTAPSAVGKPFYVWGLKDSQNADGWGESTITYNNAPGLTIGSGVATLDVDSSKADRLDDGTLLQVASGSTVSFSDADLLSFLNADTDGLVTLIIGAPRVPGEPAFLWAAKEHATLAAPTLTFDVIPEPTTALAGLLLGAGLLRRRRK
jgi:hypothetical protein